MKGIMGNNRNMTGVKERLLSNIFDILTEQGLLTQEENYCLKMELTDRICIKKEEYDKSRNL